MPRKSAKPLPPKEPWLSKTQKYIVLILGISALIGTIWSAASRGVDAGDKRYAKAVVVEKIDGDVKSLYSEVKALGKAFQAEQYDRSISNKQDLLLKVNLRLKESISAAERAQLEEVKRSLEKELEKLKDKQKKLDD